MRAASSISLAQLSCVHAADVVLISGLYGPPPDLEGGRDKPRVWRPDVRRQANRTRNLELEQVRCGNHSFVVEILV